MQTTPIPTGFTNALAILKIHKNDTGALYVGSECCCCSTTLCIYPHQQVIPSIREQYSWASLIHKLFYHRRSLPGGICKQQNVIRDNIHFKAMTSDLLCLILEPLMVVDILAPGLWRCIEIDIFLSRYKSVYVSKQITFSLPIPQKKLNGIFDSTNRNYSFS